jgi:hypothetical protein
MLHLSQQNAYFVNSEHCCVVSWPHTLTKLESLKMRRVIPDQQSFLQLTNLTSLQLFGISRLPDTVSLLTNLLHLSLDSKRLISSTPSVFLKQLTSLCNLTHLTLASHAK